MNWQEIDAIENAITIKDVMSMHGVNVGNRHRCACPFCGSKRDALSFTDKLFHCFSCGESGGVIQLEADFTHATESQACSSLLNRLNIHISNRPLSAEDRYNYKLECMLNESYEEYENEKRSYYRRMTNLFRNIRTVPELYDMGKSLRDWLDENIDGVEQEWEYPITN